MLKYLRFLLFPFSIIYGLVVRLRNKLYDKHILYSVEFDLPVICVGNLSVGGTGKTPMVEYLIELLGAGDHLAVLSRGYRRKTKGFLLTDENTSATDIGDEPMQIYLKNPGLTVAVSENRILAIPRILNEKPNVKTIILDDAFQHRPLRAGINILLTTWTQPFTHDYYLPAGNLRDGRSSSKRADIIVVTKCPSELPESEKNSLTKEINRYGNQPVLFSTLEYGELYPLFKEGKTDIQFKNTFALVVCGIANPQPLIDEIKKSFDGYEVISFKDHHDFSEADLLRIRKKFESVENPEKILITTEKDAARLQSHKGSLAGLPIWVWPVKQRFLFDGKMVFESKINDFLTHFGKA